MSELVKPFPDFDLKEILRLLPHRYPFLLVDRVTDFVQGESIKAFKHVTYNEPFFQGHFPGFPVMPGVLIVEALAQTGGLMVLKSMESVPTDKLFLFSAIDKVRFRRQVVPGDRLDLHARLLRQKMIFWKMECKAYVDGQLAADAELTAAIVDREGV
ncbi:3-hydroxyacyl-ACP dehydratase FabZ [Desulfovibrio litoralis]|uniref:3-hydroxyacyl-[acyl-carrier-protein] dehydratase FabZ n=1 Tax=Desulfovibrio litoralis DSM 11393 TaxID=1121455 RepID=A0A1M7SN81_9BACT|nr:3-hydroxyacyl-ACP dehydratase FabZ [Desulfovibrio litoralis]SHN59962.1 3-hydroxyacyl-[acyl-carrier-protein] dehydratase [Desulfovibrio litoralis DSM 11393]